MPAVTRKPRPRGKAASLDFTLLNDELVNPDDGQFDLMLAGASTRRHPKGWATYHKRARKFLGANCEACGTVARLHAHHVDHNMKHNTAQNIQTLCLYCHRFWHFTLRCRGELSGIRMPALLPDRQGRQAVRENAKRD